MKSVKVYMYTCNCFFFVQREEAILRLCSPPVQGLDLPHLVPVHFIPLSFLNRTITSQCSWRKTLTKLGPLSVTYSISIPTGSGISTGPPGRCLVTLKDTDLSIIDLAPLPDRVGNRTTFDPGGHKT